MKKQKHDSKYEQYRKIPLFIFVFLFTSAYCISANGIGNNVNKTNQWMAIDESITLPAQQQKITVTGTILDSSGEPIIGANVAEKNTTNATMTDINGKFTLTVAQGVVLQISFVGYLTQDVPVTGSTMDIRLTEDARELDEIVITGFGLSQRKATLTGAISVIGSEDISRSNSPTVSGALVGKIAGVNTRQTDGRPGEGVQIRIRNMGAPLYVIDGVQSDEGSFRNIDFNDIEAISVLKDASASIYGVRAANGVIVVTTKRGKQQSKNTLSLNAYYGWQDNFKFVDPADAKTYVRSYVQAETMLINEGRMNESQRRYSREEYDKWMAGSEPGYQTFDWHDYIWRSAPQYYVNMNFTGGTDKSNYYVSLSHLNQGSTIYNYGGFKRTNVQMNIDSRINNRLKIGASMNARLEGRKNPGVVEWDDTWLPRYAVLRNIPTRGPYANNNPLYPQIPNDDPNTNFAVLNYETSGRLTDDWRVIQLQATAEYEVIDGLKAKVLTGYYFTTRAFENHEKTWNLYRYDEATDTYPIAHSKNFPHRERIREHAEDLISNVQLAYDTKLGENTISAIGGLEAFKRKSPYSQVLSVPISNNMEKIYTSEIREYNDRLDDTQGRVGWIGRINYGYADKYLAELSGRYDGSWKFPTSKRWGFFPSASIGWRVSQEKFWQNSKITDVFSDLKIRASYGLVGDDNVDGYNAFDYLSGYNYNNGGSVIDGEYMIGTQPRGLPVKTLSWIKAKILDIGFDFGFLNNRLTGQFDFFQRKRTGLPEGRYDVVIPKEAGFDLPKENLNSDMIKGVDGMIRWSDKINDFNYSAAANATYARFYDWDRYDNRSSNSWDQYRHRIAHRYGYMNWGLEAIGQFESWEEIENYTIDNDRKGNTTIYPGDIKYKDVNGDNVINGMDERPIGYRQDATPTFNYGINLTFAWKGFDLAMDFSGSLFSTYYQRWEQAIAFHNNGNNPKWLLEDSWRLSDPWNADSQLIKGKYPMALKNRQSDNTYWGSTFWKHNVKYMKLRNLEFGYTVPKNIVSRVNISNLRVYVAGSNLFAFSNVQGIDPEQQDENGLGYPTMRVINIGINLKF